MPMLMEEDQKGFIGNRQTHDNIRRAIHIIDQILKEKNGTVLLGLEAEKAYDMVGWEFLFHLLRRFGLLQVYSMYKNDLLVSNKEDQSPLK